MKETYKGDCLKVMDVLLQQNVQVDAVVTDPPYNISRKNNFQTMKGRIGIDFGEWDKNFNLFSWIDKASLLLKENGNFIVFNDWKNLGDIEKYAKTKNLLIKRSLVFHKTNPAPFNRDRLNVNDVEFAMWFVKGKKNKKEELIAKDWVFNRQNKLQSCVYTYSVESGGGFKRCHPTQKSVKQMEHLIKIYTNESDIVLDPFMGSGTTGVACKNTNRKFIGIEKNDKYFDVANQRIKSAYQNSQTLF